MPQSCAVRHAAVCKHHERFVMGCFDTAGHKQVKLCMNLCASQSQAVMIPYLLSVSGPLAYVTNRERSSDVFSLEIPQVP